MKEISIQSIVIAFLVNTPYNNHSSTKKRRVHEYSYQLYQNTSPPSGNRKSQLGLGDEPPLVSVRRKIVPLAISAVLDLDGGVRDGCVRLLLSLPHLNVLSLSVAQV